MTTKPEKHTLLAGPHSITPVLWIIFTTVVAVLIALPFATDSPCRIGEETAECHGRRWGEGLGQNPRVLLFLIVGWVVVTFIIPWIVMRVRSKRT